MGKYDTLFQLDKTIQDSFGKLYTALRKVKYINEQSFLKRNRDLVGKRYSDTCYILGMGPSLKQVDLTKIKDDIITVNMFGKYDIQHVTKPKFYCLLDEALFTDAYLDFVESTIKTYDDTIFILNGLCRKAVESRICIPERMYYLYGGNGLFDSNDKIDLSKWMPVLLNVVCGAIVTAVYVGYKKIILLGCDFNSFASPRALHCYEEENDDRRIGLGFELFCYSFAADIHLELAVAAKKLGIEILNATPNSLIDAYPRILLSEEII